MRLFQIWVIDGLNSKTHSATGIWIKEKIETWKHEFVIKISLISSYRLTKIHWFFVWMLFQDFTVSIIFITGNELDLSVQYSLIYRNLQS